MSRNYLVLLVVFAAIAVAVLYFTSARPELRIDARDPAQLARGRIVYEQRCAACHGQRLEGQPNWRMRLPNGRLPAPPHDDTGHTWHHPDEVLFAIDATLDKWLANPQRFIPGTSMSFAGIREAKDRQDVIAYLQSVSEGKAPAGARQSMMGRRPNLKKAPPERQVTAIGHCRDTYTVKTADGKVNKVWEFNLRFKTDSSKDGPAPGRPVIVGAGMQGDRASVVFGSPEDISNFIKQSCK